MKLITQKIIILMIINLTLCSRHKDRIRMRTKSKQASDSIQNFGGIEEGWAKFLIYDSSSFALTKDNVKFFQNKVFEE